MENIGAQRVKLLIDYLRSKGKIRNASDFARMLGKKPSQISEIVNSYRPLTYGFASLMAEHVPGLDAHWLLDENVKEMFLDPMKKAAEDVLLAGYRNAPAAGHSPAELYAIIREQQKHIEELTKIIANLSNDKA